MTAYILHAQIDLDVAQRFAGDQLSKRHRHKLIEARKVFNFLLSAPGQDHLAECLQGQMWFYKHDRPKAVWNIGLRVNDTQQSYIGYRTK